MSFNSSSSSSTERSSQSYAPYIQQLQQDLAGAGFNMANPFLLTSPFAKAPLTADQRKAFDLARTSGGQVFQEGGPGLIRPSQQNENFLINAPALTGERSAKLANAAQMGQAAQMGRAEQVDGSQIAGLLNPYLMNVADSSIRRMRDERDQTASQIGARAAAGGSFGGSREAVQRAMLDNNFGKQVGETVSGLMSQGYDRATQAALNNAQMRQQTGLSDAQMRQQTGLADTQFRQQAELSNRDAQNRISSENLDTWLKVPQINSQLMDARQRRELMAAQAILAGGNQQQAFAQGIINVPKENAAFLQGLTPQVYDSNRVTNKETESSSGGFDLGSIFKGAAALMGASDERMKTDIQPMGEDPETGLLMYSYRYKGDPKSYPKVVGPMAQDVRKVMPEAVKDMGGRLAIDAGLLSHLSKKKA